MSGVDGDWASGGERIMVTRGRWWEEASGVPVQVAVLFVDKLVFMLFVRRMRVILGRVRRCSSDWARGRTKRANACCDACDASLVQGGRSIVLHKWDEGKDGVMN